MSLLNDIFKDLYSTESHEVNLDEKYGELLMESFESASRELASIINVSEAIENNFNNFIGNDSELTQENYRAYELSTESLLISAGITAPVEILAPSFESFSFESEDKKEEIKKDATEKKNGVWATIWNAIVKAWEYLSKKVSDAWDWLKSIFSKDSAEVKKEAEEAEEKVKNLTPEQKNKAEETKVKDIAKTDVDTVKKAISDSESADTEIDNAMTNSETMEKVLAKRKEARAVVKQSLKEINDAKNRARDSEKTLTLLELYDKAKVRIKQIPGELEQLSKDMTSQRRLITRNEDQVKKIREEIQKNLKKHKTPKAILGIGVKEQEELITKRKGFEAKVQEHRDNLTNLINTGNEIYKEMNMYKGVFKQINAL